MTFLLVTALFVIIILLILYEIALNRRFLSTAAKLGKLAEALPGEKKDADEADGGDKPRRSFLGAPPTGAERGEKLALSSNFEEELKRQSAELDGMRTRLAGLLEEQRRDAKVLGGHDGKKLHGVIGHLEELNKELGRIAKLLLRKDSDLAMAVERLQEIDTVKSEFVSIAAHQLRTPLTGIRWSLQSLLDGETGSLNIEQEKIVKAGMRATVGAVELVNDLLNVARIEEGRFGFEFKVDSVIPSIKSSELRIERISGKKGVAFSSKIDENLPPVLCDPDKLGIAVDSVLDNAVKYTHPGGSVALEAKEDGGAVKITVSDTGIGIPEKQMHRLFSKFFRASNAVLNQTTGTGLGLYAAKNIVEKHGGKIDIQSVEKKGTTTTITLPIPKDMQRK